jgi:hypothetical protein
MKSPTGIRVCLPALIVLFTAVLCRAEIAFLASVGDNLAMSEVNGTSVFSYYDDAWKAGTLRDPKESGLNKFSKLSAESNGLSSTDATTRRMGRIDSADNPRRTTENADSLLEYYLLISIVSVAVGLVLLAAGIVQWRRRRIIKKYWLFPAVLDNEETSTPAASLPTQLIAKKQQEESLPDMETKIQTQRRAA